MLSKEEIMDIAKETGFSPYQEEKRYIQSIILKGLFKEDKNLVFKGGTALMFFYDLPRFSEDLDFSLKGPFKDIKKEIMTIFQQYEIEGAIRDKKGHYIVKAKGPLWFNEVSITNVRIEISYRQDVEKYESLSLNVPYPDINPFQVNVLSKEEIFAEKIRAILKRDYARDLYDLYFLIERKISCSLELINKKLGYYNETFLLDEFEKSIDRKKPLWRPELEPLTNILYDYKTVKKRVIKEIRRILQQS